jgi:hypothetical protein
MSSLRELTQHKDFEQLVTDVRDTYTRQWLKENAVEARERLHVKARVLDEVVMALRNAANRGDGDG